MQGFESTKAQKVADCIESGFDANIEIDALSGQDLKEFNDIYKEAKRHQRNTGENTLPGLSIVDENGLKGFDQKGPFPNGQCEIDESTVSSLKKSIQKSELEIVEEHLKKLKEQDKEGDFDYLEKPVVENLSNKRVDSVSRDIEDALDDCYKDGNDQEAKLRLRKELLDVNTVDAETREGVMKRLEEKYGEGGEITSGVKVEYAKDTQGNEIKSKPTKVSFYDTFNSGQAAKEVIYMDKSLEENAQIARDEFMKQEDNVFTRGGFARYEIEKQSGTLPEDKVMWWDRVLRK